MAENTTVSRLMLGNTTEQLATLHGKDKQVVVDTTKHTAVVMDGVTPGGHPLAREEIKIKSGSPSLRINGGEEATLAGDVTITSTDVDVVTEPVVYNSELIIEESGDFTVPVSGWYDITVIGGGGGGRGVFDGGGYSMQSGTAAKRNNVLRYLEKDAVIPVEIGAGGSGTTAGGSTAHYPSASFFGDISSDNVNNSVLGTIAYGNASGAAYSVQLVGAGQGGGYPYKGTAFGGENNKGRWYGAGGGCYYAPADSRIYVGDGHPGAVILRWCDPAKEQQ